MNLFWYYSLLWQNSLFPHQSCIIPTMPAMSESPLFHLKCISTSNETETKKEKTVKKTQYAITKLSTTLVGIAKMILIGFSLFWKWGCAQCVALKQKRSSQGTWMETPCGDRSRRVLIKSNNLFSYSRSFWLCSTLIIWNLSDVTQWHTEFCFREGSYK